MVGEVRIYVEGGGDFRHTKAQLRTGFGQFLQSLREEARARRVRWAVVACGPRQNTYDNFVLALQSHPSAFSILLVDAEAAVTCATGEHLRRLDGWDRLPPDDDHAQLMVQTMEAWLIADLATLQEFYGQGFRSNQIPGTENVEEIPKADLEPALRAASAHTQKGEYHKIRHASKLLALVDVSLVRDRAPHCDRLFTTVAAKIGSSSPSRQERQSG